MQDLPQQLQAAHIHDVADNLGVVPTLHAGLDLQGFQLLIGDVLESLVEQVDAVR
jgi:hypothetical protein